MSTWYRAVTYINKIEPVEVIRETPQFLVIKSSHWGKECESRISKDHHYPTFAEARTALLRHWSSVIDNHNQQIEWARKNSSEVFLMEEPKP